MLIHPSARFAIVLFVALILSSTAFATTEVQTLTPSDGAADDNFGSAVDVDGDIAVVGAPFADIGGSLEQGAVYIFVQDGAGLWQETKKITVPDGAQYDQFGFSVAIDGDRIVVGAEEAAANGNSSEGVAYVFERHEGGADNWGQVAKLIGPSIIQNRAEFGHAVAIEGDFVLVGAPGAGPSTHGGAYLYARDEGGAGNWGLAASFYDDIYDTNASMGTGIAISGDRVVVGAEYLDQTPGSFSNEGGIYIFERHYGGTDAWGKTAKFFGSDATNNDRAGRGVAIEGDRIAFSAWNQEGNGTGEGQVYLLENLDGTSTGWAETAILSAGDAMDYGNFGRSVDLHQESLAVGAQGHNNDTGQAYRFDQNEGGMGNWGEADQLTASGGATSDFLGSAVAIGNGVIMVGAVGSGTGLVHVYDAPGGVVSAVPISSETPSAIRMSPAFPNPFNPLTTISFALNQPGTVDLAVFDLSGRRVRTLVSGTVPVGEYTTTWDGRDEVGQQAPSGMYFYKYVSGGAELVGKMTLVK